MLPTIIGRSSSHFTRVARVFAHELGVAYSFEPMLDLLSHDAARWGGNPALRLPILRRADDTWYGTLNICRELARGAADGPRIAWPEDLQERLPANAQELVLQGMATEVTLVMGALSAPDSEDSYRAKSREGLAGSLAWLEQQLPAVLSQLPDQRATSYLEVTTFCFVTHLDWRQLADMSPYPNLTGFAARFATRPSAHATPYQFDQP